MRQFRYNVFIAKCKKEEGLQTSVINQSIDPTGRLKNVNVKTGIAPVCPECPASIFLISK